MPKLRTLSGKEILTILRSFGFFIAGQKGSHVKLKRDLDGDIQTLTIPDHKELDKGTTIAIFNQASRYIPTEKLRPFFYAD